MKELDIRLKDYTVNVSECKLMTWTSTAIELWSDKRFIDKRIEEQYVYAGLLTSEQISDRCTRTKERFNELIEAAQVILERFQNRLRELNSGVGELVHPLS